MMAVKTVAVVTAVTVMTGAFHLRAVDEDGGSGNGAQAAKRTYRNFLFVGKNFVSFYC
jgi:hypothetical protein